MQIMKIFQKHFSRPVILVTLSSICAFSWNVVTDSVPAYKDPYTNKDLFLKYRVGVPEAGFDDNKPEGLFIYFHGNSQLTQDQVLNDWFTFIGQYAKLYNLLPVVMASPYATPEGVRAWGYETDTELIHALLQGNLGGKVKVDVNRIYMWGASQGTCFLNAFLTLRGDQYGGGGYAMCGCLDFKNNDWQPNANFRENFRVFVQANTGDFLWEPSRDAVEYYRYNGGLTNVRSDLNRAGGHCGWNDSLNDSVVRWMANGEDDLFPEPAFEPHWMRSHVFAGPVRAFTVNGIGNLLAVVEVSAGENALMQSEDKGVTWEEVGRIAGADSVGDMAVLTSGDIWVGASNGTWRSKDQGVQFSKVNATAALQLWTNGSDLYGMDWDAGLTKWNGSAWSNLNYYSGAILGAHGDFAARDSLSRNLWYWSYKSNQFRVYSLNASTAVISEKTLLTQEVTNLYGDQNGNLATMFGRFDDGSTRFLVSIDGGVNWLDRTSALPDLYTKLYWGMDVVILPNGDVLLYGGDSGFLSHDQGLTWTRMANLRSQYYAHITQDLQGDLYSASGKSIYKWEKENPVSIQPMVHHEKQNSTQLSMQIAEGRVQIRTQGAWVLQIRDAQGRHVLEQRGFGLGNVQLPLRSGAYYLRLSNQSSSVGGLWLK